MSESKEQKIQAFVDAMDEFHHTPSLECQHGQYAQWEEEKNKRKDKLKLALTQLVFEIG
jgi:hypothetical protein